MREIKYRALGTKGYTPTDGKWCYGSNVVTDYLGDAKKDNHFPLTIFERYLSGNYYDKNTRCQFTGLLDKNDVEIYEGDVVKNEVYIEGYKHVEYHNGSFGYRILIDDSFVWYAFSENTYFLSDIEVVGNVYED